MQSSEFQRRWYVYAFWVAYLPIAFLIVLLSVNGLIGIGLSFAIASLAVIFGIWGLVGYYYDAKHQKGHNANWVPQWYLWVIAHILLTPILIAPLYLLQRTLRTGTPFGEWDDLGEWTSRFNS